MWQGIGAKSSDSTGWRKNVKDVNGNVPRFHTSLPDSIMEACQRLKHSTSNNIVQIENKCAFELIERHNNKETLIYTDPPYMRETRSSRIYAHEFTNDDHKKLLELLKNHSGPVALSGYANGLYDSTLKDWYRYETLCATEAGNKKTETLWCNYQAEKQMALF